MRILVTGANGMLGTDVCKALSAAGRQPLPTARSGAEARLDVTETRAVHQILRERKPEIVIHCAAFTQVEEAERDPDAAYRVNALGCWNLATACAEQDIPLCAISTDFVFDGAKDNPYTEFDSPCPINQYGASKLAGENCVRQQWRKHWIVRTAWLFGRHGKCFPDSILRAAQTRPELRVVADQRGSPTSTQDLAEALVRLIESPLYGTYHLVNAGSATWYELARKTLELADLTDCRVIPIRSAEWPSAARRPANSTLRSYALELQNAPPLRPWEEALADYIRARSQAKSKR
jgi:dTDP-4-dehydrorhamnose reductase